MRSRRALPIHSAQRDMDGSQEGSRETGENSAASKRTTSVSTRPNLSRTVGSKRSGSSLAKSDSKREGQHTNGGSSTGANVHSGDGQSASNGKNDESSQNPHDLCRGEKEDKTVSYVDRAAEILPLLTAIHSNGLRTTVSVVLEGQPYRPQQSVGASSPDALPLGYDGNQFYCSVCHEFGDVVCCDGCPQVFHPNCIPKSDPSRKSLDDDDDPWYCPDCIVNQLPKSEDSKKKEGKEDRRSTLKRCVDCQRGIEGRSVQLCMECGNYVHFPSCQEDQADSGRVLCSTCCAVDELVKEEEDEEIAEPLDEKHDSYETAEPAIPTQSNAVDTLDKKRSRSNDEPRVKRPKRQKIPTQGLEPDLSASPFPSPSKFPKRGASGLPQAIPAFYFYLSENRWKIERVVSRKNRSFNRLPRGSERNALVAKEGAIWWSKLRPSDHRRYVNMSMRDFEARIVEWKGEKNLREVMGDDVSDGEDFTEETPTTSLEDDVLTRERHSRLYLSTSVGSKPFKPEPDQSYNRVLLDFLHDMRFHPLPMFKVDRPNGESDLEDVGSKVTIPFFDVHGPTSTSVGDECLGCLRGWMHFCHVLKRRIPAVEHRARLQPPLSSLVATRVGLGLRHPLEKEQPDDESAGEGDLFEPRQSSFAKSLEAIKVLPSCSLSDINERMDDVIQFTEESMIMKVPEPPRPSGDSPSKLQGRSLPIRAKDHDDEISTLNKCGRCRAIIQGDTGCVQCRRAQLVINMAKRPKDESKLLKVQTTMIGRVNIKETVESQSLSDQAQASALLKVRWTPSVILPPQKTQVPHPSRHLSIYAGSDDDEEEDSSTANEDNSSNNSGSDGGHDDASHGEGTAAGSERRSARQTGTTADTIEPSDHQKILEANRKQVNALQKRTVSIACCGMLHALLRRDPLLLFAGHSGSEEFNMTDNSVDFRTIRANVLADNYQSIGAFTTDVKSLCENALVENETDSIHARTANELLELLGLMQKRASNWIAAIKDAYAAFLSNEDTELRRRRLAAGDDENGNIADFSDGDPFLELREEWPEAVAMLENGSWLRKQIDADFMRTKENEVAYYGCLAVRRVAAAAEASLAPYTDSHGMFSVVSKRSHTEDEALRQHIDEHVSSVSDAVKLAEPSTCREESIHRLLRKVQSRRIDRRTSSEYGCARCDGLVVEEDMKLIMGADAALGKAKKPEESDIPRVHPSRAGLATGLGSSNILDKIDEIRRLEPEDQHETVNDTNVSVRGSVIHGWGLFADQEFRKDDVVAEYVGEYISEAEADRREKIYVDGRVQDYLFRLDNHLAIDATHKGGPGRYINHNCSPNCYTKVTDGKEPKPYLKRILLVALRDISVNEEITYDYQFPLELDLDARIPCNCQSEDCRGFMNWDLPEKGANNRAVLVQKRGANMRDRIRRLCRPLKRDET